MDKNTVVIYCFKRVRDFRRTCWTEEWEKLTKVQKVFLLLQRPLCLLFFPYYYGYSYLWELPSQKTKKTGDGTGKRESDY